MTDEIKLTELQRDALEIAAKITAFLHRHPDAAGRMWNETLHHAREVLEFIAVQVKQQENKQ